MLEDFIGRLMLEKQHLLRYQNSINIRLAIRAQRIHVVVFFNAPKLISNSSFLL